MATLFFAVWDNANQTLLGKPLQEDSVAIGGGSLQSAVIAGSKKEIRRVRLFADTDCFVTWGDNLTALQDGTEGRPFGAENPEVVGIEAGQTISVIERV